MTVLDFAMAKPGTRFHTPRDTRGAAAATLGTMRTGARAFRRGGWRWHRGRTLKAGPGDVPTSSGVSPFRTSCSSRMSRRFLSSEITNERLYLHRREFMRLTTGALASAAGAAVLAACGRGSAEAPTTTEKATGGESPFPPIARRLVTTQDPPNTFEQITGYNNFYEFGTGKSDPKRYAGSLEDQPVDREDRRACATSRPTITSRI